MPIQSVNRAIDILILFTQVRPEMGVTEISKALNMNKGTAFGLIRTLQQRGFLTNNPENQKYRLGSKLYELGMLQTWNTRLYQSGVYPVHRLSEKVGRSTRLFSWEKWTLTLILNVFHSSEQFPFGGAMGPTFPAYCTGAGKAALAWLTPSEQREYIDKIELRPYTANTILKKEELEKELGKANKRGYSSEKGELVNGINCISAPILNENNRVVGAISIGVEQDFLDKPKADSFTNELMFTAMEISRSMGYSFDSDKLQLPSTHGE